MINYASGVPSPVKYPIPVAEICQNIKADIYVFYYLEIKHSKADKVSTILKGIPDAVFRSDCPGSEYFKPHHRNGCAVDELHGTVREEVEDIVVEFIVIRVPGPVNLKRHPVLTWMSRPVIIVMHSLHVVIRDNALLLTVNE